MFVKELFDSGAQRIDSKPFVLDLFSVGTKPDVEGVRDNFPATFSEIADEVVDLNPDFGGKADALLNLRHLPLGGIRCGFNVDIM